MNAKGNADQSKANISDDPLCLFYFPRSEHEAKPRESYRASTRGLEESRTRKLAQGQWATRRSHWKYRRPQQTSSDETQATQQPRRKGYERRTKERQLRRRSKPRRFGCEPIRNLTSYLLTSVKTAPIATPEPLTHVLDTITEAWQITSPCDDQNLEEEPKEKAGHMLERRRSVPEEIIRKFAVSKDRTSESEANITMPEATSPSSKESENRETPSGVNKLKSNVFSQKLDKDSYWFQQEENTSFCLVEDPVNLRSAEEGSSDSDSDAPGMERFNTIKRAPFRRESVVKEGTELKLNQRDYYEKGRGIIKVNALEKSSQTNDYLCYPHSNESRTTPSPWEESDSAESTETLFSSPRFCTRPLSSSDNLSSESECIKCTCAEIVSSKDTSTDIYHSGKSTLSQTVSDKSTSTQDSTASINSVSSRGSSISVATDSSTSDVDPRTSAKETTTTADNTPRSPKNDKTKGGSKDGDGFRRENSRHCPYHGGNNDMNQNTSNKKTNDKSGQTDNMFLYNFHTEMSSRIYEWAQFSEEELKVLQQQRNQKIAENNKTFNSLSNILTSENLKIAADVGSSYADFPKDLGLPAMVPRYSALPRSMSMVVNSSSFENAQLSDSDCPSLADSLEDGQNRKDISFYDTKQELKPVRGEVKPNAEKKRHAFKTEPRGRAYFFSVDDEGKAELVTNIHKIPELPKQIKNKIHKRHLNISRNNELKESMPKDEKLKENLKKSFDKTRKFQRRLRTKEKPSLKEMTEKTLENRNCEPQVLPKTAEKKTVEVPLKKEELNIKNEIPLLKINDSSPSENGNEVNDQKIKNSSERIINEDHRKKITNSKVPIQKMAVVDQLAKHRNELISSLETTASLLKNQQVNQKTPNRTQQASKRIGRFQQRFEVIPEERSSSLTSSAEDHRTEKNRRRSLPVKLTENIKSPTVLTNDTENKSFRRYTLGSIPNALIAKLMGRPLQAIPCVQHGPNNQSQQIIIFSPKDSAGRHSAKGRDALLAMNREDFNRLSKGWMNFYLLKESSESDNEEVEEENGPQENNTIVCHIPSMEKDPSTTSESCTDGTITPPYFKNTFSLLQGTEGNRFQLHEISEKENFNKNNLFLIAEELEPDNKSKTESLETVIRDIKQLQSNEKLKKERVGNMKTPKDNEKMVEKRIKTPKDCEIVKEKYTKNTQKSEKITVEHVEIGEKVTEKCVETPQEKKKIMDSVPTGKISERLAENQPIEKITEKKETKEVATCTDKMPKKKISVPPMQLTAPVKLSSSNTVLNIQKERSTSSYIPKSSARSCSLPELNADGPKKSAPTKTKSLVETLPQVADASSGSEDSDSTVYLEAPTPRIPRLPLEDCYSSDESSTPSGAKNHGVGGLSREKHLPLRRRPLPFRPKNRYGFNESGHGRKPGWSVTVEGTLAFPRARPGVQMRLSFPGETGPPIVSQSDSGFVEDRDGTSRSKLSQKQQWTVTVKNPPTEVESGKEKQKGVHLPNLSKRSLGVGEAKRGSKENDGHEMKKQQIAIGKKLSKIWPRVQRVIESEIQNITEELILNVADHTDEPPLLSVEGRAMGFDTKPKFQTNSQRDVTRSNTARSEIARGIIS